MIMAGKGSIDILKWERLEVLRDPFLFLAELCLLLATVFVNGNICCLTKKLKTFVCPGRSLGNATRSAFLSVGTSGVCVSGVRRAGLKNNLRNSRKTGLSQ